MRRELFARKNILEPRSKAIETGIILLIDQVAAVILKDSDFGASEFELLLGAAKCYR